MEVATVGRSELESLARLCADLNASKTGSIENSSNWIVAIVYFLMASLVGFTYIASLRHQVHLNAVHRGSLELDNRLSLYVYALPVLGYVLLESLALARSLAQYKCDLCMLGLVSGMVIAMCKRPSTRGVKLVVWSSQQRHLVWVRSPRETLARVQEDIALALGVTPASRVCFNIHTTNEHGADLSVPLSSLVPAAAAPAPPRDFFGFPLINVHVSVQSLEALQGAKKALAQIREGKEQAQAHVSKRQQLIKSISGIFGSKKGAAAASSAAAAPSSPTASSPASAGRVGDSGDAVRASEINREHGSDHTQTHTQTPIKHAKHSKHHFSDRISLGNRLLDEQLEATIDEGETDVQRSSHGDAAAKAEADSGLTPRRYAWTRMSLKSAFSGKRDASSTPSQSPHPSPVHRPNRGGLGAASFDDLGGVGGSGKSSSHTPLAADGGQGTFSTEEEASPPLPRSVLHAVPKPRREQVDAYVDAILNDPAMNIAGIPDKFERKIYTLAISMALQQCLKVLFSCNGKAVLGHHVELEVRAGRMPVLPPNPRLSHQAVTRLVGELLSEKMINLTWLHDSIEGPLYVNVILAILTVMHSFFAATKFDMLGHSVSMQLTPLPSDETMAGIKSRLRARRVDEDIIEEQLDLHFLNAPKHWLPDSLERPIIKTLYALVLCATEEVFKDMRIGFLGDTCILHLVPGPMPSPPAEANLDDNHKTDSRSTAAADRDQHQHQQHASHELLLAAVCGAIISHFLFR